MAVVIPQFQQRAFGYSDALAIDRASTLPAGQGFVAGFEQSLDRNPTASASRWSEEMFDDSLDDSTPWYERATNAILAGVTSSAPDLLNQMYRRERGDKPKFLSPEEANEQYGIPGQLSFTNRVSERVAADTKRLKIRELEQQWTISNLESGIVGFSATLAGGFAGSALDPINLATAALPLGWFRGVGIVSRLGKTSPLLAEISAQAMQGAAGALLVEPIIASRAWREQADYTAADSAANILFGAGLGATFPAFDALLRTTARPFAGSYRLLSDFSEGGIYRDSRSYFADVKTPTPSPLPQLPTAGVDRVAWAERLSGADRSGVNQAIAEQFATRLANDDLNAVVANLTPNRIQAAVNSANQIYRELSTANIPAKQKSEAMDGLRKFIADVNEHHGYQAFTPLPDRKPSALGSPESLDDFIGRLHPAFDAVADALEKAKSLSDLSVSRIEPKAVTDAREELAAGNLTPKRSRELQSILDSYTRSPLLLDTVAKSSSVREFLAEGTNSAIYQIMDGRIANGQTMTLGEIENVANLDPIKIRADIEAGRKMSLDEFRDWKASENARLAEDTRPAAQVANDERAMQQLVSEERRQRLLDFTPSPEMGIPITTPEVSKASLAVMETSDMTKLAAAAKEDAQSLESELIMPADAEMRKMLDEYLRNANDDINNLANIKSIADQLVECVLTP